MQPNVTLLTLLALFCVLPLALGADASCYKVKDCAACQKNTDCFWCAKTAHCADNTNLTLCESGWCNGETCEGQCSILPWSGSITGIIFLLLVYGAILGYGAKTISDGSELLLEILDPGLIGGLLLPVLGAVPDAAIVVVSGALGTVAEAQEQLAIGVGTLAGSTIMLLTIPWGVGLILARTDIRGGEAVETTLTKGWSLTETGTSVDDDTPRNAKIMLFTSVSYLIGQGVAFAWLADPSGEEAVKSEHGFAIAGFIVCTLFFVLYLVYQVVNPKLQEKKIAEARRRYLMQQVLQRLMSSSGVGFSMPKPSYGANSTTQPLIEPASGGSDVDVRGLGMKWKKRAKDQAATSEEQPSVQEEKEEEEETHASPKTIAIKAILLLIWGTALVSVFSDPMVDVIADFGNTLELPLFYVSFIITPLCSNASELVASLVFATKKKKANSSLFMSALYGAATMNNTMVLGIFFALIAFRGLAWTFSAEVLAILLVTLIIAPIGFRTTIKLWWFIPVILCYPLSLVFVGLMESVFNHIH